MTITVVFFATLRDVVGERRIQLAGQATQTVRDLRAELATRYPDAAPYLEAALCSVNQEYADNQVIIPDEAEVAFFPPVSGGSDLPEVFLLPYQPFDQNVLLAQVTTPQVGAVVTFSGTVRGQTTRAGHLPATQALFYEAYEPMALAKMQQIAAEIRAAYPGVIGIALVQRLGSLAVGENTITVACSAAHRDDGCFEAARYGIDRLKEIVPVWKKELGADGERWIVGDYIPQAGE